MVRPVLEVPGVHREERLAGQKAVVPTPVADPQPDDFADPLLKRSSAGQDHVVAVHRRIMRPEPPRGQTGGPGDRPEAAAALPPERRPGQEHRRCRRWSLQSATGEHTHAFGTAPEGRKERADRREDGLPVNCTADGERWRIAHRAVLDHLLGLVAGSPLGDALVLRGSMVMPAWVGAAAREPADLDWIVPRPLLVPLDPEHPYPYVEALDVVQQWPECIRDRACGP